MADSESSNDMAAFKSALASSKRIIAVAGAGLSAASGIPTFRGAGGLWRKYDAISLASPEAFGENPSRVWQFYHYRRETALKAKPNNAHRVLARFSFPDVREQISPGSTFVLITQNVDGLSTRALAEASASLGLPVPGSEEDPALLEMHGRVLDVVCTQESCGHRETDLSSPICLALGGTEEPVNGGATEPDIPLEDLPRCKKCGALSRPGVVWFGEQPHHLPQIYRIAEEADLCLVIGTSSTVYPAGGFAFLVKEKGGKVAIFNIERSQHDEHADFIFLGPCEKTLPEALGIKL